MKTMKTMLAMVVALCLVMSLSIPALATTVATTTATEAATTTATEATPGASEATNAATGETTAPAADATDDVEEGEPEEDEPMHTHADGSTHPGAEHTENETTTTGATETTEAEAAWKKPVRIVLVVLEVLASLTLGAVVLMQSGKEAGLSGALTGNSDSYMNKSGKGGLDKTLAKSTKWVALVWLLLTLALCLI